VVLFKAKILSELVGSTFLVVLTQERSTQKVGQGFEKCPRKVAKHSGHSLKLADLAIASNTTLLFKVELLGKIKGSFE
jgi:hypothetical protein